jgi:hypothetical protein
MTWDSPSSIEHTVALRHQGEHQQAVQLILCRFCAPRIEPGPSFVNSLHLFSFFKSGLETKVTQCDCLDRLLLSLQTPNVNLHESDLCA